MADGYFALAGVIVGALLNALRESRQRIALRSERHRLEVLDLVSGFLRDVDTVWLAKQRLTYAVAEIMVNQSSAHGNEERMAAFDEMRQPRRDALLAIGRMRLIAPGVVEPALALLSASEVFSFELGEELTATRERAMRTLEEAVRPLVK